MKITLWIAVLFVKLIEIHTQGTSVSLLHQTYYVFPGENVTLTVNVTYAPNVEHAVFWTRNRNNLSTQIRTFQFPEKYSGGEVRNPSLTILNVNESDTGDYSISVIGARFTAKAGPARVYVLSDPSKTRYEEGANSCPVGWETVYEIDTRTRPPSAVKACVLNTTSTGGSFYNAQQTCRKYKSAILPLSPKLYQDSNIEAPPFAYPIYSFWTGAYDRHGSLVTDGTPPIHLDESFISIYFGSIYVSGDWTEDNPLCIGSQNALRELHIRNCNDKLPFLCYKTADDITFTRDLNICPPGWIGGVDMESCYLLRDDSTRTSSRSEAVQFCKQKGGELLQLKLVSDWRLAMRILGYYRLVHTYVWYNELSGITNCPSLYLNERMVVTSTNNCSLTSRVICQTSRKTTEYSSNDIQIIFQQPTTKPNISAPYNGGEITCNFPKPHLETDTYRLYKGGNLHTQLKDSATNYSTPIMSWNNDDNSAMLILASAASDIEIYTCEVQRKGFGYVASQEVYAIPNGKRVFVLHGSVRFIGLMGLSDALLSTYWGGTGSNQFSRIDSQIRDWIGYVGRTLFSTVNSALRFLRIQDVSLKYGDAVYFLMAFVAPSDNWISSEGMKDLLINITEEAKLGIPGRRKRQVLAEIDYKTIEIRSEVVCTVGYSPEFQSSFTFQAVGNGSTTYSEIICITDSQPLLTGVCYTSNGSSAEIRHVTVNDNCRFLLDPAFTMMSESLKNLSEISPDSSNVESIASEVANLTSDSSELEVPDVVYTSVILQNIAKIPSISVQTLNDVLQTFTNVLEAPESTLMDAHDIGSSTTRIIESVETITRNATFNGTLYQNFQKGYAVAAIAPDAPSIVGIQVEKKDGDADLSNETVNLITAEEYSNMSSINTGIVLPEVSVQGNKTKVIFTVYENTNLFQVRADNKRYELNGNVWSATLVSEGRVVTDLGGKFVMSIYKPVNDTTKSVCGFWNHSLYDTSGGWSTNGCQKTEVTNDGRVVCQCDHLTNFAILLDIKGQDDIIDPTNTLALSVITIIGLSLSIIGLGFTVLSFILFKQLRQGRGQKTLLNLALALLCSMIVFLAGMERTESYYGCIAVAALMHYFLLVSFMWMLVEGFLQYLRFVRVLGTYIPRFILKASIPAWGLPLLPVIIVLAVDYDLYKGGNYYCWMSRTPFYFAFLIPVALIILINCVVFIMVLKTLLSRPKGLQSNQSESKRAMMNLRASLSIFIILGLTWTFGILAIEDARLVFSYIFTILTTFQGFFIFILFIAREKKLRNNWKKLCCKRFEGKEKKYKTTSDSSGSAPVKIMNASYDSHTTSTNLK